MEKTVELTETVAPVNWRLAPGPDEPALKVIIKDSLELDPTDMQWDILRCRRRNVLVAGGERAGKSWVSGTFGASRTPYGTHFWIVAATYDLARPEFGYWTDHLARLGAFRSARNISIPKQGKCVALTKSGQTIETKSADDILKIAAVAPDGIIMAEAAQMPYEAYLKCIGRVAEKRGWLLMSGTFEGSLGWYPEKFTEWQLPDNLESAISFSLPSWSNRHIYPGGRDDPEIKRLETIYARVPGLFEERCGAVPVPPSTLIFREFRHSIHVNERAAYDSKLPTYLAIDPSSGGDPYAVLAIQVEEDATYTDQATFRADKIDFINIIDEYYKTQITTEDVVEWAVERPWFKTVRGGAIDCEAPDEQKRWLKLAKVPLWSHKVDQMEGIRRLKSFLYYKANEEGVMIDPPHIRINPKVRSLPFEFSRYKRKTTVDDNTLMVDKPPANQPDHSVKALWYFLVARYGYVKSPLKAKVTYTWKRRM